jgi:restriction system protein
MPIPQFHEIILPLLRRVADGREWTLAALRGPIADDFGLTAAERAELLPSNTQSRFVNRPCWTKIHLERAGLLTRIRRRACGFRLGQGLGSSRTRGLW